jgi:hypothetical protein
MSRQAQENQMIGNREIHQADDSADMKLVRKRVASLKPSPENLELHNPVQEDDPELHKLAESIRKNGLHEPLAITEDNYIVSGHRRLLGGVPEDGAERLMGMTD